MLFTYHHNAVFMGNVWFDTCATEADAKARAAELNRAVKASKKVKATIEFLTGK